MTPEITSTGHLTNMGGLHVMRQDLRVLRARERELKAEMRQLSKQDLDLQEVLSRLSVTTSSKNSSNDSLDLGFDSIGTNSLTEPESEAERHRQELTATEEAAMLRLHELADEEWALEQEVCKQQVAMRAVMMGLP